MTEGTLSRLSKRMRALALAPVLLDEEGRRLTEEARLEIETARAHLNDMLDQVLDGHPLGELQQRHIAWCRQLVDSHHPAEQQLELYPC